MTASAKELYDCFYGKDSSLNTLGKIVLWPMIMWIWLIWTIMDLLFKRDPWGGT